MKKFFNLAMVLLATIILAASCTEEKEPNSNQNQNQDQDDTVYFTAPILSGGHSSMGSSNMYMCLLTDEGNIHNYMFVLYNQLGEIDENGYVTIPYGTYTPSEGSENFTMSTIAMYRDNSTGAENAQNLMLTEATAVVSENQIVLTANVEGVKHVVTYNGAPSMLADIPEADVNFEANYVDAYYAVSSSNNVAIFQIYISDLGLDKNGNVLPNGSYYKLTLYSEILDPKTEIAIPAGRYEINNSSNAVGSITNASYYVFSDSLEEDADYDSIDSGYLTVKEDGTIEASFVMYFSGATHTITFSGEVKIHKNSMPYEGPYSTLTSDKEVDLSNHTFSLYSHGDLYGTGYQTWTVNIAPIDPTGDEISFEILCGTDEDVDISGKYTVSDSMEEYTIIPGYVDGFTLMSSWYYHYDSDMHISDYAPIVDGWMEIKINDDDTATITFDVYDDLENHLTKKPQEEQATISLASLQR